MEKKEMQTMMEDLYRESEEDTIWAMASEFYSRRMLTTTIFVWLMAIIFLAGSVCCIVLFFGTEQTQYQILYASIFILCVGCIGLMKIFAWEMFHKNSIKREIKRLEIRIAQLTRTIQDLHDKRDDDSMNVIT